MFLPAMPRAFDYDATDISRAYARARRLTEERRRVWRGHLSSELGDCARRITWLRASADALPFGEAEIDLVFMYLVYHHLRDPLTALRECARVLTPSGRLLVINATLEILDSLRWLPFFPSARGIDIARLPVRTTLSDVGREAGLSLIRQRTVAYPVASSLTAYADHVATRTFSTLQLVSDEEFDRGATEFRRWCTRQDRGQPVEEVIDMLLFCRQR
jgi:SAM-dependent methyltransferase